MNNPFAPPTTDPRITVEAVGDDGIGFYVVGKKKFWILSIMTMGLYVLAWGYKSWKALKVSLRLTVWPVMRAIFGIFFMHSLMRYVEAEAQRTGRLSGFNFKGAATTTVWVLVFNYVLDRLSAKNIGSPWTDFLSLAFVAVVAWAIWQMQNAINHVAGDPEGSLNTEFTTANRIWMVLGGLLWLLVLVGTGLIIGEQMGWIVLEE